MGKKAAHSGQSPKDRSINLMDKFITRNERRNKHKEQLPGRRKDPNVPLQEMKDVINIKNSYQDEEKIQTFLLIFGP